MKITYCGDCCDYCPRYRATLSGNFEDLKKAAELMKKVGWPYDLNNLESMKCRGCQDIGSCEYQVKDCCIEKKISNCGECSSYPCEIISRAFEITEQNAIKFKNILSKEEYYIFTKAFFKKKENIDMIASKK